MTPEQLKASILKYAMQGKLVEQKPEDGTGEDLFCKMQQVSKPNKNVTPIVEEEIPFDIPSSWKWCKFGELVDCSMGKTPPRAEPVWWQNDIHWVSISDMKNYGHISYTKEMVSQKALEEKFGGISTKGTLLMSFKLTVGRTSILDIIDPICTSATTRRMKKPCAWRQGLRRWRICWRSWTRKKTICSLP